MKKFKKILKIVLFTILGIVAVFTFLYMYTSGRYHVMETVAQDSTISHIVVDSIVFHSESFGADSNRVVVVVHGGPGNDYRYLLSLKDLSDEYKVVFYDQRGTGLSPRVDASELTLESSIEDLDRVINYYSPDSKVNIIGHSWGAMLASAYLGRYPNKVNKIVLAEPGFLTPEMARKFEERTNGFKMNMSFGNFMKLGKLFFHALHLRGPDDDAIKDYIFSNIIYLNIDDHPMAGYFCNGIPDTVSLPNWRYSMTASMAIQKSGADENGQINVDFTKGIEQYQDTVLFLAGECDKFIGPDFQQGHLVLFPKHKMVVIKEAGHNMLSEAPNQTQKVIRNYFKEESSALE